MRLTKGMKKFVAQCQTEIKKLRPKLSLASKADLMQRGLLPTGAQSVESRASLPTLFSGKTKNSSQRVQNGQANSKISKREVYSSSTVQVDDSILKGFTSQSQLLQKQGLQELLLKKQESLRRFEFITAPKHHRIKLKHNANESTIGQTLKSRVTDRFNSSQISVDPSVQAQNVSRVREKSKESFFPEPTKQRYSSTFKLEPIRKAGKKEEYKSDLLIELREQIKSENLKPTGIFATDKYLRHPIKDGLKLLMICDELVRETVENQHVRPFEDAVAEENSGKKQHYFIAKEVGRTNRGADSPGMKMSQNKKKIQMLRKDLDKVYHLDTVL